MVKWPNGQVNNIKLEGNIPNMKGKLIDEIDTAFDSQTNELLVSYPVEIQNNIIDLRISRYKLEGVGNSISETVHQGITIKRLDECFESGQCDSHYFYLSDLQGEVSHYW